MVPIDSITVNLEGSVKSVIFLLSDLREYWYEIDIPNLKMNFVMNAFHDESNVPEDVRDFMRAYVLQTMVLLSVRDN